MALAGNVAFHPKLKRADFFFVPPRFNFAVSDAQYVVTSAVMLVVALVVLLQPVLRKNS